MCQDTFCQCSVRTATVCVRIHSVNVLLGLPLCVRIHSVNVLLGLPLCVSGYILSMFCQDCHGVSGYILSIFNQVCHSVCQDTFCQCSVRTVTVCVRIHSVNVLLGLPLCVSGYILSMFC